MLLVDKSELEDDIRTATDMFTREANSKIEDQEEEIEDLQEQLDRANKELDVHRRYFTGKPGELNYEARQEKLSELIKEIHGESDRQIENERIQVEQDRKIREIEEEIHAIDHPLAAAKLEIKRSENPIIRGLGQFIGIY